MGRLSGKYTGEDYVDKMKGNRKFGQVTWEQLQPVLNVLNTLGDKYQKTPAQIAINWVIQKGCVPIVGCKNEKQAIEAIEAAATNFNLSLEDVGKLDKVSIKGQTSMWQGNST